MSDTISDIEILCNGEFGGGDYTNISSYTIEYTMKNNEKITILLDSGSFNPKQKNLGFDSFTGFDSSEASKAFNAKLNIVFLSHAHIDHSKDFLLNLKELEVYYKKI